MTPSPVDPPFTASTTVADGVAVVHVAGDLDLNAVPVLRDGLTAARLAGVPVLVVDVSEVAFCDSVGMSELVLALHRGQGGGTRLILRGAHGVLAELLHRTGLYDLFEHHATSG